MVSGALMLLIFSHLIMSDGARIMEEKRMYDVTYYCKIQTKGEIKALRTKKKCVLEVWIGKIFREDPNAKILESYAR